MPRMDEKKLHTWQFQLKSSGGNMRCKLLQKIFTGKTIECFKHLHHIAIEKDIWSEPNRCIFQISLMYIKLVIPKILFMLVLCSFNFYFKITWPPHPTKLIPPPPQQNKNFWTPPPPPQQRLFWSFYSTPSPSPAKLEGAMPCWVPLTITFCRIVRAIFQTCYVCRRVNLWLNCHFSRK